MHKSGFFTPKYGKTNYIKTLPNQLEKYGEKVKINYKKLGKRIATCRRDRKILQKSLAQRVGISNNHMSNIENGRTIPSLETFVLICEALNRTPDYFLLGNIREDSLGNIMDELLLCDREKRELIQKFIRFVNS